MIPRLVLVPALALLGGLAFFMRDPERHAPPSRQAILAPADGRVIAVDEVADPAYVGEPAVRVRIFLSLLDVHVNRSPVGGTVGYRRHVAGSFRPAFSRAADANERNEIGIACEQGRVLVVQSAGAVARRIVCGVREGDPVSAGERIGAIRLGSRVDLLLPRDRVEVLVAAGARVRAGESVVARWI